MHQGSWRCHLSSTWFTDGNPSVSKQEYELKRQFLKAPVSTILVLGFQYLIAVDSGAPHLENNTGKNKHFSGALLLYKSLVSHEDTPTPG